MKRVDDKCLQFVVTHYKQNKLNTQRALNRFRQQHSAQFQVDTVKKKTMKLWMLTSGIAAAFILVFAFQFFMETKDEWKVLTAHTEALQFLLPDKSSVFLYPHSSLSFQKDEFLDKIRQVRLEGKANFKVEKDTAHPFVVIGKLSKTKVLGTEFTIDESRADTAIVQVMSGKVQFSATGQPNSVILTEGMAAQITGRRQDVQIITEQKTSNFIFDNTPLTRVLEELSKFYKVKLTTDHTDKRLTAHFKDKNLDEIIEIIEKVLNVKIEKKKQ